jgi:calcineurin-like phosphoesterase family protein
LDFYKKRGINLIYFIADTHFNHENIIRHSKRPFKNAIEMNNVIITNWNEIVSNNDDIYILGDFAFADGKTVNNILSQLNGRKYLLRGNHDSFMGNRDFNFKLFQWIKDYYVLRNNGQKYILFHYPIEEWDGAFHGSIHLYGHIHNNRVYDNGKCLNVGVDVNNFKPISIDEINKRMETK